MTRSFPSQSSLSRPLTILVAALALVGIMVLTGASSASAAVTCNLYASPSGSDSATGSVASPYRSVQKLVNSLSSGQTGCLRAGTYGGPSTQTTFSTPGITVTSYPGERATIAGYPLITGAGSTLSYLDFDENNLGSKPCPGQTQAAYSLDVEASNVTVDHDNIYQNDVPAALRTIGIGVGWSNKISNTVIRYNKIHDLGGCLALTHGIYDDWTTGDQIYGNWIYSIAHGFGIQMYPHPVNAHVYDNVIDSTGSGITVGAEADTPITSNIQIDHNLITNSTTLPDAGHAQGVAISMWWGSGVGTGNTFHDNISYSNPGGVGGGSGLTMTNTSTANPTYTDAANHDYRVAATSPAASWGLWNGDLGSTSGTTPPPPQALVPTTPAGVNALGGTSKVTVSWAANPGAQRVTNYNVYRTDQTFAAPWASATATTFTNTTGIVNGTRYCYQVSATNAAGESAKSTAVCATPAANVPSVPSGLRAVGSGTGVSLTWTANPAGDQVSRYNVYRTDQTFSGPWASPTGTSFTNVSNVVSGNKYCYQLSAANNIGESPKTAAVCAQL